MPRPKSLDVHGKAFVRAREVCANIEETKLCKQFGKGTQEWLADITYISVKTIRALETGNKASLRTIDIISDALKIKGREFIVGYGEHLTTCRAFGVIDFRSVVDGKADPNYPNTPFVITIDPLWIEYFDDFTDSATLDSVSMELTIDDLVINFQWLYLVELTASAEGWLGYQSGVFPTKVLKEDAYNKSVMFNQNEDNPISWGYFIDFIRASKASFVTFKVKLKFEFFEKTLEFAISTDQMRNLFDRAQLKYDLARPYPYWMQLKPVEITS